MYGHELPKTGFSGLIYATVAAALGLAGLAMKFAAHLRNR
jgi:LPXTG-motif cell wall-anchored protein